MKKLLLLLMTLFTFMFSTQAATRYVDAAAAGAGDGTSWTDAYTTIAAALSGTSAGNDIWVKVGTYNITAVLTVKSGVNVYGGFIGTEETINDRVKSDLDENGTVDPWEYKNATVLIGAASASSMISAGTLGASTIWDGFSITNHIGISSAVVTAATTTNNFEIRRCIFSGNNPTNPAYTVFGILKLDGGSIGNECLFENNFIEVSPKPYYGGIVGVINGSTLKNSIIRNNSINSVTGAQQVRGGSLYLNNNAIALNNLIYNNTAAKETASTAQLNGTVYIDEGVGRSYLINTTVANCSSLAGTALHINKAVATVINTALINSGTAQTGGVSLYYYNCAFATTTTHANVKDAIVVSSTAAASFILPTTFSGVATTSADSLTVRASKWSIQSTSPFVDAGTDTVAYLATLGYSTDILGNSHNIACTPAIKKWDIGAYEFQKTAATFTWAQDFSSLSMGGTNVPLTAELSNGDDINIVYTTDDPLVATIAGGNELKIEGAGSANVIASYFTAGSYACSQSKVVTVSSSYTPSLSLPTDTLKIAATAGLDSMVVTSNSPFSITNTLPTWLTPEKTSGNNAQSGTEAKDTIRFTISANPTPSVRYAKVLVSSGGLLDSVIVKQAAGAATFSLSKTSSNLAFKGMRTDGKADTISVTSNTAWSIDKGTATWLTASPMSGNGNDNGSVTTKVALSATAQTYPNPLRTAILEFNPAGYSGASTATVTQEAAPAPGYIFVDGNKADDSDDGSSWATAKKTIKAAITAATANRDTVCVKAGTYIITETLAAVEGVSVYGGFAGTETNTVQRARANATDAPWSFVNATILDANNTGTRILSSSSFSTITRWDGFTLQNVKNPAANGGAASLQKNMHLYNSIIQNNTSTGNYSGIGVLMHRDAGLYNSLIQNNEAPTTGGAIYINGGTTSGDQLTISGCHFIGNRIAAAGNGGSAIANYFGSGSGTYTISKCLFANNTSMGNGGAIYSNTQGTTYMLLEDCVFTGNTANGTGGAGPAVRSNFGAILNRCLLYNNSTSQSSITGTVYINGTGYVYNSVIANNSAPSGAGDGYAIFCNGSATPNVVAGSTVVNNVTRGIGSGAAVNKVVNTIVQGNTANLTNVKTGGVVMDTSRVLTSGVDFRIATSFRGVATTAEELQAIVDADWRTTAATAAGANLTGNTYAEGDLLLTDLYNTARPASGAWNIGAYNYVNSLIPNPITWTQTLALDLAGSPKEMTLSATALASGSVRYTVDNTQVAYIENGNILKAFAPGTTTVRVNHSGDATHAAATEVAKEVVVSGPASTLSLSAYTLNVAKTANSDGTIKLTSNYGYTIPYKAVWITSISPATIDEASTERTITFTVAANPNITPRTDSVVFLSGGLKQKLEVTQVAGDPALSATPASVTLSALEGDAKTFSISSNTAWSIAGAPEWANLSATSGTGNATITVTITQEYTNTSSDRNAPLTLSAEGASDVTVTLVQSKAQPAAILYVAGDIAASGDGASWTTAKKTIGEALSAATNGNKIFVKAGTYSIDVALRSKAGVRVYGGFAGTEVGGDGQENNRQRPTNYKAWEFTNSTIIEPAAGVRAIDSTVLATPATWDGFTLQGARHISTKADSARYGGAAHLRKNTFLNNCIIRNNIVYRGAGGVYMDVDARVYNSLIERNRSMFGGGGGVSLEQVNTNSNYTPLQGNMIADNRAHNGAGVAINFDAATYSGTLTLFNNYFTRDTADLLGTTDPAQIGNGGGGALYINLTAICTILTDSCTFDANWKITEFAGSGTPGGGGVRVQGGGGTTVFNRCAFINNHIVGTAGASALHTNDPNHKLRVYNSLFKNNRGGKYNIELRSGHMMNNTVVSNEGAGIGFIGDASKVLNNAVNSNGTNLETTADLSNFSNITFVDSANNNYRLKLGSTGVDKGKIITLLETDAIGVELLKKDFAGTARPQGASYDPGMYEYIKVKPSATIAWAQDLSNLDITSTDFTKLTATVSGASADETPYLSPIAYVSSDVLTVDTKGDTLILMGTGTTTVTAHTNINPYYDTVSMVKTVTVTGSNYLAVTPTSIPLDLYVADSVTSFKLNTDNNWSIAGVPDWISLSATSGNAGRAEIWISILIDNSLTPPRSTTLTITAGSKTRTVTVNQNGLLFSISATEVSLLAYGDSKDFDVTANLAWGASSDVEWLTVSPAFGIGNATVYITPSDNDGPERTATISVQTDRDNVPALTISVVQAGTPQPPTGVEKETVTAFIYPNPTSGMLTISLSKEVGSGQLQIFNTMSVLVHSEAWSGTEQNINISHLGSGLYFLQLNGANGKVLGVKIIKK